MQDHLGAVESRILKKRTPQQLYVSCLSVVPDEDYNRTTES